MDGLIGPDLLFSLPCLRCLAHIFCQMIKSIMESDRMSITECDLERIIWNNCWINKATFYMGLFHGMNQRFTFMLSSSQTSSNNSTNNTYISKSCPRNCARNTIVTNPLHRLASSSSVDKWSRVSFARRRSPGSRGGSAQNSNPLPFFYTIMSSSYTLNWKG